MSSTIEYSSRAADVDRWIRKRPESKLRCDRLRYGAAFATTM